MKDFIIINSWIYHGLPKPAKHLAQGDHILFGGKICMVMDAKFKDESRYPNDLQVDLLTVSQTESGKLEKQEQHMIVDRDFEVQPLIIAVIPARMEEDDNADVEAAAKE
jgi:hypothetical protein